MRWVMTPKEAIIYQISLASELGKMTTDEAIIFYQAIIDELKEMIDCINDGYCLEGEDV